MLNKLKLNISQKWNSSRSIRSVKQYIKISVIIISVILLIFYIYNSYSYYQNHRQHELLLTNSEEINKIPQTMYELSINSEKVLTNPLERVNDNISYKRLSLQIDSGMLSMCNNQLDSGRLVYEVNVEFDEILESNNNVRQSGSLYAIGKYYHDSMVLFDGKNEDLIGKYGVKMCYLKLAGYLNRISVEHDIRYSINGIQLKDKMKLIDNNTGSTALVILGIIETCLVNIHDSMMCDIKGLKYYIYGLISMHYSFGDKSNNIKGFNKKFYNHAESPYYNSESYLVFSKLAKYYHILKDIKTLDDIFWKEVFLTLNDIDIYFGTEDQRDMDNFHWICQAWYLRYLTTKDIKYMDYIIDKTNSFSNHVTMEYIENRLHCDLIETFVDIIDLIDFDGISNDFGVYGNLIELYKIASQFQINTANQIINSNGIKYPTFPDETAFHTYKSNKFSGGFLNSKDAVLLRVDNTQHCICGILKLREFLYNNKKNT